MEKSKGDGNSNNSGKSKESSPTTSQCQQFSGIQTVMAPTQSEEELKGTVLLDSSASNHIVEYTSCINHDPILAGTTLEEVEGTGRARVTVATQTGKIDITFRNALYVPTYQSHLVLQAILEEQGAFYRLESWEIVYNGKNLYQVIRRGKHYTLEEASPRPQGELLNRTNLGK